MHHRFNTIVSPVLLILSICGACGPKVATIVLIPDTQYYSEKYPHIMHSQIDWIAEKFGVKVSEEGGSGYLRTMKVDLNKNLLNIRTYSPYLNKYIDNAEQSFTIKHVILNN